MFKISTQIRSCTVVQLQKIDFHYFVDDLIDCFTIMFLNTTVIQCIHFKKQFIMHGCSWDRGRLMKNFGRFNSRRKWDRSHKLVAICIKRRGVLIRMNVLNHTADWIRRCLKLNQILEHSIFSDNVLRKDTIIDETKPCLCLLICMIGVPNDVRSSANIQSGSK